MDSPVQECELSLQLCEHHMWISGRYVVTCDGGSMSKFVLLPTYYLIYLSNRIVFYIYIYVLRLNSISLLTIIL